MYDPLHDRVEREVKDLAEKIVPDFPYRESAVQLWERYLRPRLQQFVRDCLIMRRTVTHIHHEGCYCKLCDPYLEEWEPKQ